jgi:hypothetical protein
MPKANLVASHIDRLWVADVKEGNDVYPNRVRWSHPAIAESWRESDYIDIVEGGSGITALVPFGDQLLVFKKRAVFAILGYDEETFQVVPLSREIGAVNSQCVAVSEQGVFFFSWPDGLFVFNGTGFTDLFVPLRPLLQTGEITETSMAGVYVSWCDRRVFVSLPVGVDPQEIETYDQSALAYDDAATQYGGSTRATTPTATFVWDSTIREGGSWTKYVTGDGYGYGPAVDFVESSGSRIPVCAHVYQPALLKIDQEGIHTDTFRGVTHTFDAYYYTKWQDAQNTSAKKFWRRPEMVVRQLGHNTTLNVDVYHNWNRSATDRSFTIQLEARDISGGYNSWVSPDLGADLAKGNNLGLANSVQLKISTDGSDPWGVNAITYKFNPRRVRV